MRTPLGRAVVVALALGLAVGLFLILQGDDGGGSTPPSIPATGEADGDDRSSGGGTGDESTDPEVPVIAVRGGEPVGGVEELEFTRGDRIRFVVRSDVADHVHLHGYDVSRGVSAGGEVAFDVPATIEGVFEVELEDRVVPLAEITVNPG